MSYFNLARKTVSTTTFYVFEFLLNNAHIFLQSATSIFFGLYFNTQNTIFSSNELVIYYLCSVGILNVFQRNIPVRELEREVEMGNLSVHLAKPYNFVYYFCIKNFASKIHSVFASFAIVLIISSSAIQFPSFSILIFLRALIILPVTIFYIYLSIAVFMYLTIIFERMYSIANMYGMMAFFAGGGLISTEYFPAIFRYLPQQFYFSGPIMYIFRWRINME